MDLLDLTASQAAPLLQSGALGAEEFARACLDRVATRDPLVRTWTSLSADHVLAQARELDRAGPGSGGPLHGLPVGVKDVILTHDLPTQYNSALYRGFHPRIDAACVALLRAAGAVVMGKTDTVEFAATGRRALTRNPHDLGRTPGGSSSGSAAAVADRQVPLALGTQTGGSMIRPASFCGAHAFKPTWGLASNEGCKRFSPTLDTLGWFGRSVDDLSLLLDVLAPPPVVAEPVSTEPGRLRIALCRTPMWERTEAPTRDAFEAAATMLRAAGAELVEIDFPSAMDDLPALQLRVMYGEARPTFWSEHRRFPGRLEASLQAQVDDGHDIPPAALRDALDRAALARIAFDRLAEPFDAVLTPSVPGVAPVGLANTGDLVFCGLWTLLHVPCVNLPGWQDGAGLPVGLTLTGPRYADRRVLGAAAAIERLLHASDSR